MKRTKQTSIFVEKEPTKWRTCTDSTLTSVNFVLIGYPFSFSSKWYTSTDFLSLIDSMYRRLSSSTWTGPKPSPILSPLLNQLTAIPFKMQWGSPLKSHVTMASLPKSAWILFLSFFAPRVPYCPLPDMRVLSIPSRQGNERFCRWYSSTREGIKLSVDIRKFFNSPIFSNSSLFQIKNSPVWRLPLSSMNWPPTKLDPATAICCMRESGRLSSWLSSSLEDSSRAFFGKEDELDPGSDPVSRLRFRDRSSVQKQALATVYQRRARTTQKHSKNCLRRKQREKFHTFLHCCDCLKSRI